MSALGSPPPAAAAAACGRSPTAHCACGPFDCAVVVLACLAHAASAATGGPCCSACAEAGVSCCSACATRAGLADSLDAAGSAADAGRVRAGGPVRLGELLWATRAGRVWLQLPEWAGWLAPPATPAGRAAAAAAGGREGEPCVAVHVTPAAGCPGLWHVELRAPSAAATGGELPADARERMLGMQVRGYGGAGSWLTSWGGGGGGGLL